MYAPAYKWSHLISDDLNHDYQLDSVCTDLSLACQAGKHGPGFDSGAKSSTAAQDVTHWSSCALQSPGGQAAQIIRIPQYDWSERWPPSRMAQQVKAILNKQIAASPGHSRSSSFTEQLSRAGLVRTPSGSMRG